MKTQLKEQARNMKLSLICKQLVNPYPNIRYEIFCLYTAQDEKQLDLQLHLKDFLEVNLPFNDLKSQGEYNYLPVYYPKSKIM